MIHADGRSSARADLPCEMSGTRAPRCSESSGTKQMELHIRGAAGGKVTDNGLVIPLVCRVAAFLRNCQTFRHFFCSLPIATDNRPVPIRTNTSLHYI